MRREVARVADRDCGQGEDDSPLRGRCSISRAIYEMQIDGNEMRIKLADIFIMLEGVSLETGAFYIQPPHFPS